MKPWSVHHGVLDEADAVHRLFEWAGKTAVVDKIAQPKHLRLLAREWISSPETSTDADFLAMHFDRGHALLPIAPAPLYLHVGLWRPPGVSGAAASTRVATVRSLVMQRAWGGASRVRRRLAEYSASHGSSWDWDGESGHRVSCFARILDALSDAPTLTSFRTTPRSRWFEASHGGSEFTSAEGEYRFYASKGIDLRREELHIQLKPGQLLLLDNLRCVHGRVGRRCPSDVCQLLVGIENASRGRQARVAEQIIASFST